MQMKISISAFAAILVIVFFTTLYMANADSFLSSPVQSRGNQDAINTTITDGLRLANETSQRWQEKHNQSNDQQEQPANVLNSRYHQFDNHSPSVISGMP
jgi:hypothetical protein